MDFSTQNNKRPTRRDAMKTLNRTNPVTPMTLGARTAADLMTPNPLSIRSDAKVAEAAAFLASRAISAAPVIDEAGRPIGVVSSTDILVHKARRACRSASSAGDTAYFFSVADVMTPVIFCIRFETEATRVVEKMLGLKVRRLFVVDDDGVLIGVISTFDVLRRLRRWGY
jgi:CBS domain-containing protein